MGKVAKKSRGRKPTGHIKKDADRRTYQPAFFDEWIRKKNKTRRQVAEALGISEPHLSRIVRGERPWDQKFLEALSDYLMVDAGSLLMRDPTNGDAIWSLWERASVGERREIERYAEFLVKAKKAG